MTIRLKAVALSFGIGLATAAVAQPAQQPSYQGQMPPTGQMPPMGQMSQMGQGMGQVHPMMNDPQMRAQMSRMAQGCGRMMSMMGDDMRRPEATRR